ncbi:MAG: helix-turn-helix domain-containing protein [Sedimentisphaerales bacterium]|nr:helix-turn-helix domain-containing protein [Sedimentisphaerales bacterium]
MAKMFYTVEEAQQKLGCTAAGLDDLVKEGLLREFRDTGKKVYKVDEVDNLAASGLSSTGSGEIQLAPEPEDTSGSMTGIPLSDTGDLAGLSAVAGDTGDQIGLEDTSSADSADDTVVTSHGVNVLDDSSEGLEPVDPLAQTQIAPDMEDLADQVSLDSASSGSGLLDLSREADDTSLGAELLEEIYPGSDEGAIETQVPGRFEVPTTDATALGQAEPQAAAVADYTTRVMVEDPTSGAFGAMLVLPFLVLILLSFVAAGAVSQVRPSLVDQLSQYVWFIVGGIGGVTTIIFLVGMFLVGRTGPAGGAAKPKKAKKSKK